MKKFITLIFFAMILFVDTDINATCKDNGQNNSNGLIKTFYDCSSGVLKVYGSNKYGNLGTGNYKDISQKNAFEINGKVQNKKIIDYFVGERVTYILTSDNKIFASGYRVADGTNKRSTFIDLVLYGNSKFKIKELIGYDGGSDIDKNYYGYSIVIKINNKMQYEFDKRTLPVVGNDNDYFSNKSLKNGLKPSKKYPVYSNRYKKNTEVETEIDRKGRYIYLYSKNEKDHMYKAKYYKNGKLTQIKEEHKKKRSLVKYNGKYRSYKEELSYKTFDKKSKYNKKIVLKMKYFYTKKGKLYLRKNYKLTKKNKFYLNNVKEYKKSKKGKKYHYITFYSKKGKALKSYKYQYNKKKQKYVRKQVKLRK